MTGFDVKNRYLLRTSIWWREANKAHFRVKRTRFVTYIVRRPIVEPNVLLLLHQALFHLQHCVLNKWTKKSWLSNQSWFRKVWNFEEVKLPLWVFHELNNWRIVLALGRQTFMSGIEDAEIVHVFLVYETRSTGSPWSNLHLTRVICMKLCNTKSPFNYADRFHNQREI